MSHPEYLYLYVTRDKYELPLIVTDSIDEMAKIKGISIVSIRSMISREKVHGLSCRYKKVKYLVGEEDDDDE